MKGKCIEYKELPNNGNQKTSWNVTFEVVENDKKVLYNGITLSKFEVGREDEFIVEKRTGKTSGKEYNYIKKPQKPNQFQPRDKVGTILATAMSYALDVYMMEPFNAGKIDDVYHKLVTPMLAAYNSYQTEREKDFVSFAMSYAVRVYKDEGLRSKFQKAMKYDGKDVEKELNLIVMLFNQIMKSILDVNKTV